MSCGFVGSLHTVILGRSHVLQGAAQLLLLPLNSPPVWGSHARLPRTARGHLVRAHPDLGICLV